MGVKPSDFGPEIREIVTPKFAEVVEKGKRLIGEVIHVDSFGNIITNFTAEHVESFKDYVRVRLGNKLLKLKLCKAYAEVEAQKPLAIIGSHDFLEISINMGNAAQFFGVKAGDLVTLYRSL